MTRKELDDLLDALIGDDFTVHRGGLYAKAPENGWSKAIGIGTRMDRANNRWYLEPTVHVRSVEIETIYVQLSTAVKPKPRLDQTSTLSSQLGYLQPRKSYHAWQIGSDSEAERTIVEMKQAILTYGPVLWARASTRQAIFDEIERGEYIWPGARPYKLPIVYGLTGRKKEAIALLMETAGKLGPLYAAFVKDWFAYFEPGTKSLV